MRADILRQFRAPGFWPSFWRKLWWSLLEMPVLVVAGLGLMLVARSAVLAAAGGDIAPLSVDWWRPVWFHLACIAGWLASFVVTLKDRTDVPGGPGRSRRLAGWVLPFALVGAVPATWFAAAIGVGILQGENEHASVPDVIVLLLLATPAAVFLAMIAGWTAARWRMGASNVIGDSLSWPPKQ